MAKSEEIFQEVEKTLGIVPQFLKELAYDTVALEHSWE
jgi:hypothetical protein